MKRKEFQEWGRKGGKSTSGAKKVRGDKAHYSRLGKKAAVAKKWKGKLPPEAKDKDKEVIEAFVRHINPRYNPLDRTD
jgi:general stress protein YciG